MFCAQRNGIPPVSKPRSDTLAHHPDNGGMLRNETFTMAYGTYLCLRHLRCIRDTVVDNTCVSIELQAVPYHPPTTDQIVPPSLSVPKH